MRAVGILGSPRPEGNCATLLREVMKGAVEAGAETAFYDLGDMEVRFCRGCDSCALDGVCVIDDDMQTLYQELSHADLVVLASPVYFSGLSAQMKVMVDRCQCLWHRYIPTHGRAALIMVGGMKEPQFRNGLSVARSLFATVGLEPRDGLLVGGMNLPGEVATRPEVLRAARSLGESLISED